MKTISRLICTLIFSLFSFSAWSSANIEVSDAYARATFAMATTGAVYMTLHNHSEGERTLKTVKVSESLADEAQIHTTQMVADMAKMREVKEGVKLPLHQSVEFVPGGHHIMLLGLKKPLIEGETISLTLIFDDNSSLNVEAMIRNESGETSTNGHHDHSHH
ncbi:copper chaperone PCu(A)C [Alteromonas ponticola]|uniref:Copper chaperone PCu(A)C n=1 Tax=Alteromonas ponticola TaxID=2720613 RepID=A0ABX1R4D8_9ALTE|nr:copper chaperone PCu(A)C [Alteromonas ponticola]NMH60118.1 copper chaperone PCu(A)C [Alteromonas ponticola]